MSGQRGEFNRLAPSGRADAKLASKLDEPLDSGFNGLPLVWAQSKRVAVDMLWLAWIGLVSCLGGDYVCTVIISRFACRLGLPPGRRTFGAGGDPLRQ
jgi:hypothetical protein